MLAMTWFWYIKPKRNGPKVSRTVQSLKEEFDTPYHTLIDDISEYEYSYDACKALLTHIEALEEKKEATTSDASSDVEKYRMMAETLEQKSHSIIHISHQMRTSLSGLLGFTHFLSDTDLTEEQQEFVGIISDSSDELLVLVNGILDTAPMVNAADERDLSRKISKITENETIVKNELPHVLVVDDNDINKKLLAKVLENFKLEVSFASNGKEAFELRKENHYDMIFMDIQMPVMDGVDASIAIRKYEKEEDKVEIPIVALTANTGQSHREKYLNAGMNDYMVKPISIEDVKRRVAQLK